MCPEGGRVARALVCLGGWGGEVRWVALPRWVEVFCFSHLSFFFIECYFSFAHCSGVARGSLVPPVLASLVFWGVGVLLLVVIGFCIEGVRGRGLSRLGDSAF